MTSQHVNESFCFRPSSLIIINEYKYFTIVNARSKVNGFQSIAFNARFIVFHLNDGISGPRDMTQKLMKYKKMELLNIDESISIHQTGFDLLFFYRTR